MNTVEYLKMEAREEMQIIVINNLTAITDFSDEKIALIAGVSKVFVQEVYLEEKE